MTYITEILGVRYCFNEDQYKNYFHQFIVVRKCGDYLSIVEMDKFGTWIVPFAIEKTVEMITNYDEKFLEALFKNKNFPVKEFLLTHVATVSVVKKRSFFKRLFNIK